MSSFREAYAYLSDGRPIYYFEEGSGIPLLYSHMSIGNADNARPIFESMRDRFHCIALDRVGYRRSGCLDRPTTLEEQVEAISVVHRACVSGPLWILSHSAGGNFAVAYAATHPDHVLGHVLFEPALYAAIPEQDRPPGVTAMIEEVVPLLRAGHLREGIARFHGTLHPELSREAQKEFAALALSPERRAAWEGLAREQPLVVSWSPTPAEWAGLTQPSLVMAGGQTGEVLLAAAAKVAGLLPRGELEILKGLDHGAPFKAPGTVAQRTMEFIDRHGPV